MRPERHARLPGFASLICILTSILLPLACTPAETRGPEATSASVETPLDGRSFVARHITGNVDLVCPKATIRTALLEIARQRPDLHLVVDPDLTKEGPLDTVIGDLNLRQIPVEEALRLALAARQDLVFRIEPQRVRVTTVARVKADLVTAVFPVDDILPRLRPDSGPDAPQFNLANIGYGPTAPQFNLANIGNNVAAPQFNLANIGNAPAARQFNLANIGNNVNVAGGSGGGLGGLFTVPANGGRTGGDRTDVTELLNIIKQNVNTTADPCVAHWGDEGGNAEVTCKDNVLWVTQSRPGQEQVAALLAQLRAALAKGQAPGSALAAASVTEDANEPEETLAARQLLETRIDVDFDRMPLADALPAIFAKAPGLQCLIGLEIAEEGIDLTSRLVTLSGKRATVRSVLFHILGSDLGYDVRPGYLLVTTRARLQRHLPVKTYDITPLLERVVATRLLPGGRVAVEVLADDPMGTAEIINVLKQNVNATNDVYVAQWSDEGGPAVMQYIDNVIVASQTPRGHQEVAKLLCQLMEDRKAVLREYIDQAQGKTAQLRAAYKVPDDNAAPEDKAVLEQLEQPVNFQFAGRPLAEVITMIRQAAPDLNIFVSPEVAAEGIDIDSRKVSAKANNAPVRDVLGQVLGRDLDWRVKDGWVEINTRARLQQNLPVVTYPVQNLVTAIPDYGATAPQFNLANIGNNVNVAGGSGGGLGGPFVVPAQPGSNPMDATELINRIRETVNASSDKEVAQWSDEGGPAVIQFLNGVLIVTQTRHGHQKVCEYLNAYILRVTGGNGPTPRQAQGR